MSKKFIRNWQEIETITYLNTLAINVTNRDKYNKAKFSEELLQLNLDHIKKNTTGHWKGGDVKKGFDYILLFFWNSQSGEGEKDLYLAKVKYDENGFPLKKLVKDRYIFSVEKWEKIGVSDSKFKDFCAPIKKNDSQITWLLGQSRSLLASELRKEPKLEGGYKDATIKIRLNHGSLRKLILKEFNKQCCVSAINNPKLLICSHIKPYSKSKNDEQNNPENLLLLAANWDQVFDKFLITFDANGKVLISSELSDTDLESLGISKKSRINPNYLSPDRLKFLSWHRKIFEGLKSKDQTI